MTKFSLQLTKLIRKNITHLFKAYRFLIQTQFSQDIQDIIIFVYKSSCEFILIIKKIHQSLFSFIPSLSTDASHSFQHIGGKGNGSMNMLELWMLIIGYL